MEIPSQYSTPKNTSNSHPPTAVGGKANHPHGNGKSDNAAEMKFQNAMQLLKEAWNEKVTREPDNRY